MLASSPASGTKTVPLSPLERAHATLEKHLPGLPSKRLLPQKRVQKCDVGCITDLCSSEQLPEVEIFSLLEEQIPKYKIRADTLTKFVGCDNQDWFVPFPTLPISPEGLGLTRDQAREVLNYFLLSGNRVSQMTRTYDDIEAVTRLLAEKEKDLELTVQIGKELLTQNNRLENRVAELEAEIKSLRETLAQLSHELHQKNELVSVLTNDCENDSENSTPNASKSINLDLLQRRITSLEDENKSLRTETYQLVQQTDEVEEQERRLMADITLQLNSTASEFDSVCLELERQKEENRYLHEQNCSLRSVLSETEIRLHSLTVENEENSSMLIITKETQNSLATELCEFKTRYQEVLALLHEAQEQLRRQRKRQQPLGKSSLLSGMGTSMHGGVDSLQSELMESSLYSDNSLDSGISSERGGSLYGGMGGSRQLQPVPAYKKIFETVRCATNNMSQLGSMAMSSSSQPRMSSCIYASSQLSQSQQPQQPQQQSSLNTTSSVYSSIYKNSLGYDGFGGIGSLGQRSYSRESLISESEYPGHSQPGLPGAPGAKDLEAALKRLTPAEVLSRRAMLQHAPAGTYSYDDAPNGIPLGCRTPDSIMSTGSSGLSGISSSQWRLPEKLQIVKPLEGSQTLHHWSRLAQPNMDGLLEERPGVTIRGGRGLDDLGLHIYSLSDVEEDEDDLPGKQFQASGCVYTYTNSTVMHPDDGSSITFSLPSSQLTSHMPSENTSRQPSCPATPRASLSRRNSCSTFSVNMGLASMLNERGIKAVTSSQLNTPCGPNYTPTSTPCNSPDGSPTRSLSPEPEHMNISGLLATGAELLRRKLIGEVEQRPIRPSRNKIALSRLERKQLRSIRIMDKVESIGLENIMLGPTSNISPLALHGTGSLYAAGGGRGRANSPMTQLTSLKNMKERRALPRSDDNLYHIDKETIRAVLNKGMSSDSLQTIASDVRSDISSDVGFSDDSDDSYMKPSTSRRTLQRANIAAAAAQTRQLQAAHIARRDNDSDETTDGSAPVGATDVRLRQMQRQKSRRNLKNGGTQRPDLGQVGRPNVRSDLGTVGTASGSGSKRNSISNNTNNSSSSSNNNSSSSKTQQPEEKSFSQGFVGTISSLLFGRKGGLL